MTIRKVARVAGVVVAAFAVQWAIANVTLMFGESVRMSGHYVGLW
jgi:hypothetical protein